MSKLMLKRKGKTPVEISEEDFTRAMAEYIYRHWQETHSELIVTHKEQQFVVVPKKREAPSSSPKGGEQEKENNQ